MWNVSVCSSDHYYYDHNQSLAILFQIKQLDLWLHNWISGCRNQVHSLPIPKSQNNEMDIWTWKTIRLEHDTTNATNYKNSNSKGEQSMDTFQSFNIWFICLWFVALRIIPSELLNIWICRALTFKSQLNHESMTKELSSGRCIQLNFQLRMNGKDFHPIVSVDDMPWHIYRESTQRSCGLVVAILFDICTVRAIISQ